MELEKIQPAEHSVLNDSQIAEALTTLTATSAAVDDYEAISGLYSEEARLRAWRVMRNNQKAYNAAYDLLKEAGIRIRFDQKERRYVRIVDL